MLASRHHNKCRKLRQPMRVTSTLKLSSNQKGLLVRHRRRSRMAAPSTTNRVNQCGQIAARDCDGEMPALSFKAVGCLGSLSMILRGYPLHGQRKIINHEGHEVTRRTTGFPLCAFVSFVVNAFLV